MFQKYSIFIKILILVLIFVPLYFLETVLFSFSANVKSPLIQISITLIQSLAPILFCFFFFQTFKYFRLPTCYYKNRPFENEKYFRILGVSIFRKILVNSFLRHANSRVYLKGRSKDYLRVFLEETKQSETSHLFAIFLTLIPQFLYLRSGQMMNFWLLTLFSVFFNLYPMLLQRKNRFHFESRLTNN